MEEVDNIILNSLKEIECEFVEDVSSLGEFSTENVVEAAVRCLRVINKDLRMSHSLPPGMSARFRIGTALAQACQSAGYRGDIGYQTFLYSSETDIRKLFMFLVEKLPRKKDETVEQPSGKESVLQHNISRVLKNQMSRTWLPSYCRKNGMRWSGDYYFIEGAKGMFPFTADNLLLPERVGNVNNPISEEILDYYRNQLPYIHCQVSCHSHLIPSILEKNASELSLQQEWENKWNTAGVNSRHSAETYKKMKKENLEKLQSKEFQRNNINKNISVDSRVLIGGIPANSTFSEVVGLISNQTSRAESLKAIAGYENELEPTKEIQATSESAESKKPATTKQLSSAPDIVENHIPDIGLEEAATEDIPSETEEKMIKRVEKELKVELTDIIHKMETMETEVRRFQESIVQAKEDLTSCKESNDTVQEKVRLQKKTLSLLPNAEENVAKLEAMVQNSQKRMVSLGQQWDKHRIPLLQRYEELKTNSSKKQSESERKLEELKLIRQRIKENTEEMKRKDQMEKQLTVECGEMSRDVSRKSFTKRIFEIVANIRKQKEEIERALSDVRTLQKEINQLEGRVERTFIAADEAIFQDAKKDDSIRQAYKYLVSLNGNCAQLLDTVERTGGIMREIRELEEQIASESKKNTASNLKKITVDFKEMKKENTEMVKKLKSITASPKNRKTKS